MKIKVARGGVVQDNFYIHKNHNQTKDFEVYARPKKKVIKDQNDKLRKYILDRKFFQELIYKHL